MKKLIGAIILFISFFNCSQAQQFRSYSNYIKNPYLYNPAFAGYDNRPVIYITHKQQWMGIEGAPITSNLSFHSPAGEESPVALGANVYNDQQGIFSNWGGKFTFAYALPLAVDVEHYLKFGLSAGVTMNQIDLGAEDISGDNVLENINTSTFALDGRFGLHYRFKALSLGFTIPQLFEPSQLGNQNFNEPQIERLERMLFSGRYELKLDPSGKISLEAVGLYHMSENFDDQWEAAGILNLFNTVWVGGGYNPDSGPTALAGINAGEGFSVGYAFGTGGNFVTGYGNGTHEIQVRITFGEKVETVKRTPRLKLYGQDEVRGADTASVIYDEPSVIEQGANEESVQKVASGDSGADTTRQNQEAENRNMGGEYNEVISRQQEQDQNQPPENPFASGEDVPVMEEGYNILGGENGQPADETTKGIQEPSAAKTSNQGNNEQINEGANDANTVPPRLRMEPGFYVIVGTFSSQNNAEKFSDELFDEGFFPEVGYHQQKQFYYVYLFKAQNESQARGERNRLRQYDRFKNAWLMQKE